jgi:hypothetical protein
MLFNEMEEEVKIQATKFSPCEPSEIKNGIKYWDFKLKPNDYKYVDWLWLFNKIEARISIWCNRWLSRGVD